MLVNFELLQNVILESAVAVEGGETSVRAQLIQTIWRGGADFCAEAAPRIAHLSEHWNATTPRGLCLDARCRSSREPPTQRAGATARSDAHFDFELGESPLVSTTLICHSPQGTGGAEIGRASCRERV